MATEQQTHRIEGVVKHLDDFIDKRFAQARRVNPKLGTVEADIRWHQMQTVRQVLGSYKGFGPQRLMVCDILCSTDEAKKRDLFNPVDQASIMNEVIPQEEKTGHQQQRAGQLEIRDVKSFYKALDPSLEKMLVLLQTWIWWDLRDAADLFRFDLQQARLRELREGELNDRFKEHYRAEMKVRPGVEILKQDVLEFELGRTRDIVEQYRERRNEEHGYQIIVVSQECAGSTETDALCVRLAKRLMAIDKIKAQKGDLDPTVKQYYGPQMGMSPDGVTREAVLSFEEHQAARERQTLSELLSSSSRMGSTVNYKVANLDAMEVRLNALYTSLNVAKPEAPSPARAAEEENMASQQAPQATQAPKNEEPEPQFQIPNF